MSKIKIFLSDDHMVLRSGLKLLLNSQSDMEVIGEAGEGKETLALLPLLQPDILLLDLSMPDMDGVQVLESIQMHFPTMKCLVLTMHDDEQYVKRVLLLGARGYILKRAADIDLLGAIRMVFKGGIYVDPTLSNILVRQAFSGLTESHEMKEMLSEREQEILQLVAMGYTNRQIAEELIISIKTVESHKAHIKSKLGLKGRSELVRYAIEHGILSVESDSL